MRDTLVARHQVDGNLAGAIAATKTRDILHRMGFLDASRPDILKSQHLEARLSLDPAGGTVEFHATGIHAGREADLFAETGLTSAESRPLLAARASGAWEAVREVLVGESLARFAGFEPSADGGRKDKLNTLVRQSDDTDKSLSMQIGDRFAKASPDERMRRLEHCGEQGFEAAFMVPVHDGEVSQILMTVPGEWNIGEVRVSRDIRLALAGNAPSVGWAAVPNVPETERLLLAMQRNHPDRVVVQPAEYELATGKRYRTAVPDPRDSMSAREITLESHRREPSVQGPSMSLG